MFTNTIEELDENIEKLTSKILKSKFGKQATNSRKFLWHGTEHWASFNGDQD